MYLYLLKLLRLGAALGNISPKKDMSGWTHSIVARTSDDAPKKDMSGWTHSIVARTSDDVLHAPRKDFTP